MQIKIKKLHPDAITPKYSKIGDAGMDIYAVDVKEHFDSFRDEVTKITIDSGLAFEIPEGYVGLVFPRSSIQSTGLRLSNCVGVIDSGYRGSVKAVFDLIDPTLTCYEKGDRFAQIIIMPYPQVTLIETDNLSETERGNGAFGSTGLN